MTGEEAVASLGIAIRCLDGRPAKTALQAKGPRRVVWLTFPANSILNQPMSQRARADSAPIPFIDIAAQRRRLQPAVDQAIARVVAHCQFILGPEVKAFETALAAFCGARHAVSCASGTDALVLVLRARGIGPGDAVICPSFTFCATAEVVVLVGATPVFADVDADTFNLDPASLERAIATAKRLGLKPKAVIPVDLFGLPADHDAIAAIAKAEGLLRARRRRAIVRRDLQRPSARHARARDRHQLLSRPSRWAATATAARC